MKATELKFIAFWGAAVPAMAWAVERVLELI